MAEKLIRLEQLQRFKTKADAKYQNKLTAGNNISISGNTISAIAAPSNPTFTELHFSGGSTTSGSITTIGNVTLMPGIYFLAYTCRFWNISGGYRQCGFSTNTTDMTGFGRAWGDSRVSIYGSSTYTMVSGVFDVSASSYPNGRTFYFLTKQNSGSDVRVEPYCSYVKLA